MRSRADRPSTHSEPSRGGRALSPWLRSPASATLWTTCSAILERLATLAARRLRRPCAPTRSQRGCAPWWPPPPICWTCRCQAWCRLGGVASPFRHEHTIAPAPPRHARPPVPPRDEPSSSSWATSRLRHRHPRPPARCGSSGSPMRGWPQRRSARVAGGLRRRRGAAGIHHPGGHRDVAADGARRCAVGVRHGGQAEPRDHYHFCVAAHGPSSSTRWTSADGWFLARPAAVRADGRLVAPDGGVGHAPMPVLVSTLSLAARRGGGDGHVNPPSRLFHRQVESLRGQTLEDFTCIVTDDGSDEDRKELMRQQLGADPRFVFVEHAAHVGLVPQLQKDGAPPAPATRSSSRWPTRTTTGHRRTRARCDAAAPHRPGPRVHRCRSCGRGPPAAGDVVLRPSWPHHTLRAVADDDELGHRRDVHVPRRPAGRGPAIPTAAVPELPQPLVGALRATPPRLGVRPTRVSMEYVQHDANVQGFRAGRPPLRPYSAGYTRPAPATARWATCRPTGSSCRAASRRWRCWSNASARPPGCTRPCAAIGGGYNGSRAALASLSTTWCTDQFLRRRPRHESIELRYVRAALGAQPVPPEGTRGPHGT